MVMYEMLTGCPPFDGEEEEELYDNIVNKPPRDNPDFTGTARDCVLAVRRPAAVTVIRRKLTPEFAAVLNQKPAGASGHGRGRPRPRAGPPVFRRAGLGRGGAGPA